jgi:hypothetical protein
MRKFLLYASKEELVTRILRKRCHNYEDCQCCEFFSSTVSVVRVVAYREYEGYKDCEGCKVDGVKVPGLMGLSDS